MFDIIGMILENGQRQLKIRIYGENKFRVKWPLKCRCGSQVYTGIQVYRNRLGTKKGEQKVGKENSSTAFFDCNLIGMIGESRFTHKEIPIVRFSFVLFFPCRDGFFQRLFPTCSLVDCSPNKKNDNILRILASGLSQSL